MEDNKKTVDEAVQLPTDGQLDEKSEAVLKKHDKESATRKLTGAVKKIFFISILLHIGYIKLFIILCKC